MKSPVYINGIGLISPQDTKEKNIFPDTIRESEGNLLRCIEPGYAGFLNPVMARRMGRIIKMGIAASVMSLRDSGINKTDAVIFGTGLGSLGETEKFLLSVIRDDEQYLTPTSFIQSLQNSIAGQVAMHIGCTGHNFTFTHKGFSFESALLDAMMLLETGEARQVLTGGIDEMTEINFRIYKKLGHWKQKELSSKNLFNEKSAGTIAGEGAAVFVLSNEKIKNTYAILESVGQLYKPANEAETSTFVTRFLEQNGITVSDIDLVVYGYNGDSRTDSRYDLLCSGLFKNVSALRFKHLCGEYQTSGGFALWLASVILKNKSIPAEILHGPQKSERLSRVLIYNSYGDNHSFLILNGDF